MKKTPIISGIIAVVAVIMAFSFTGNNVAVPETSIIYVHVTGCPDGNCNQISYCIDGGLPVSVGSCDFSFKCQEGTHTICVKCGPNIAPGGMMKFECPSTVIVLNMNIQDLKNCDCGPVNKK